MKNSEKWTQGIIQKYSKTKNASEDHQHWYNWVFGVCAQDSKKCASLSGCGGVCLDSQLLEG